MITIIDNTLTLTECNQLIELYYQNIDFCHTHNGTSPININNCKNNTDELYQIIKKILHKVYSINKDIELDWIEIVKWPTGAFQDLHLDIASSRTVFTSITYLNDDIIGGNTYIGNGITVGVKTGRTVLFNGIEYPHGVKKVTNGTRFTVAAWYKNKLS
jgi:hypothetical protein